MVHCKTRWRRDNRFQLGRAGYVLAGGGSTRFGRDKASLSSARTPLLLQIVKLAQYLTLRLSRSSPAGRNMAISTGNLKLSKTAGPAKARSAGLSPRLNIPPRLIQHAAGILFSAATCLFFHQRMASISRRPRARRAAETQVILPHSAHGPEPLCACYRTDAAGALKNVFDRGIRKVTEALKQVRTEVLDESAWKRFDSAGRLFWNMNTPADFEEAQRLWKLKHDAG